MGEQSKSKPNLAAKMVASFVVIFPSTYFIEHFLKSCGTDSKGLNAGLSSIILTAFNAAVLLLFYERIRDAIWKRIPTYKLNSYFGSKLEETIKSFKNKTK
jgi:hypothetical protein